ncbi:iron uptake system protein EfeO [Kushneria phyllosphaerae]|uniref:Iron uptake system component EfeO n=1 Tax=Kushneria phyllosphaerae TaxID=2100822 RepID=A0A2R8CGW9_9GAMM|nr:iron uptake system protein EfeO [Kushneria phyllosphaerae]SPJ32062.1 Iron uptake system component EfeO [Kushneria phyllosphaerae]
MTPTAPSPRTLRTGLWLSFVFMLMALAVFAVSLKNRQPHRDGTLIQVTASGCEPARLEVPAGQQTFTIVNRSDRAIEWEIIDGVMVLAERENITPGLQQPLTVRLKPGDYAMTCGLLSNPRGTLHVTPGEAAAVPETLAATAFVGPLAEYRVYTTLQMRKLQRHIEALHQAVVIGDLVAAQNAWREARRIDQHLAVPIGLFSDLDQHLNARADDFARRDQDPEFTGFHRLANALFVTRSTADLQPMADQLVRDIKALETRLADAAIPPALLASGSARILQAWHDRQTSRDALTPQALDDLKGLTEGVAKIVMLLDPLLQQQAPDTARSLNAALATLQQDLVEASAGSADRHVLEDSAALAGELSSINHALGLSG